MNGFLTRIKRIRVNKTVGDCAGFALATFIRNWMRSLHYECVYYDRSVDPIDDDFSGPYIYVFWHEYIPFMFYLRGHCDISMLVSQHRDAELLSRAAGVMGFEIVRGSSRRGAITALREMLRKGRAMNLTITPDGPRGPRRRLANGCVYLASRLNIPLVPVGLGYQHPWRNRRAWDHFAIPKPFSRACAVIGPPIYVPQSLGKVELEGWRRSIETALTQITEAAEHSATTGIPLEGSVPCYRQSRSKSSTRSTNLVGRVRTSTSTVSTARAA